MYKKMHVTYSDLSSPQYSDLTLTYNINETSIAQRWATLLDESIQKYTIDDPRRLYGFDTLDIEREKAVDAIKVYQIEGGGASGGVRVDKKYFEENRRN